MMYKVELYLNEHQSIVTIVAFYRQDESSLRCMHNFCL